MIKKLSMKKLSLTWGILFLGISTKINSAQKHFKSLLHSRDYLLHKIITRNLMDSKQYWMKKSLNNVPSCQVLLTRWTTHMCLFIELWTENLIKCIWRKWKEWRGTKTLITKMIQAMTHFLQKLHSILKQYYSHAQRLCKQILMLITL